MKLKLENSDLLFEIDDEDYDKVKKYSWCLCFRPNKRDYYIATSKRCRSILLSRVILNCTRYDGVTVDHKDGDTLNNKKSNLRKCSIAKNAHNSKIRLNSESGYKGVTFNKAVKKWRARICLNFKNKHLGYFDNKIEAAIAYDDAAIELFGEYARLNFPLYGA